MKIINHSIEPTEVKVTMTIFLENVTNIDWFNDENVTVEFLVDISSNLVDEDSIMCVDDDCPVWGVLTEKEEQKIFEFVKTYKIEYEVSKKPT